MKKYLLIILSVLCSVLVAKAQCPQVELSDSYIYFCSDAATVNIGSLVLNPSDVTYTVWSGTGEIRQSAGETVYVLSQSDKEQGGATVEVRIPESEDCTGDYRYIYISRISPSFNLNSRVVCGPDLDSIALNGGYNMKNYIWSTDGKGSFSDVNGVNPYYYPSPEDLTRADSLSVFVTAVGDGVACLEVKDTMKVKFNKTSVSFAEDTIVVCNGDPVQIGGITNAADNTHFWEIYQGTGSLENTSLLNTTYLPGTGDEGHLVQLRLYTNDAGQECQIISDLFIQSGRPSVSFNNDSLLSCSFTGQEYLYLNNTTGSPVSWTSTGSGKFDSSTSGYYTYSYSDADTLKDKLVFYISSSNVCGQMKDSLIVTKSNLYVKPLKDTTICAAAGQEISFSAEILNAEEITWNLGWEQEFAYSEDRKTITYTVTQNDLDNRYLYVSVNARNKICSQQKYMSVSFDIPYIGLQDSVNLCLTDTLPLSVSNDGLASMKWSSTGTGKFFPADNKEFTHYIPTLQDSLSGAVSIVFKAIKNSCNIPYSDTLFLTFKKKPVYAEITDVNSDFPEGRICTGSPFYPNGQTDNNSGIWKVITGNGQLDNPESFYPQYKYTSEDIARGKVTLALIPVNTGSCLAVGDTVDYIFRESVILDAGQNQILQNGPVQLQGTASSVVPVRWTGGTGVFSNPESLNTTYTPSAEDLQNRYVYLVLYSTDLSAECVAHDYVLLTAGSVCSAEIVATTDKNIVTFNVENGDKNSTGMYLWDFGDFETGYGKSQVHAYSKPGDYIVQLNYVGIDSVCFASDYYVVNIQETTVSLHRITGKVLAGTSPLDKGVVSLFEKRNGFWELYKTDEIIPSDNGSYTFENLVADEYLIFTGIDFESFYSNKFMPAYYGDKEEWEDAAVINLAENLSGADINLIPYVVQTGWRGTNTIMGNIVFNEGAVTRVTAGNEEPVQNAVITLYRNGTDRLTSTYTDPFGNYVFEGIGTDDFTIGVEYPGSQENTQRIEVTASGDTIIVPGSSVVRQNVDGTNAPVEITGIILYPNPAAGVLNISGLNGEAEITFTNTLGVIVTSEKVDINGVYTQNVSEFAPGVYIVELKSAGKIFRTRFTRN